MPNADQGSSSNSPEMPSMRWQFIDASNNSRGNLTRVKRHVMQEYMRQKKGERHQNESEEENSRPPKRERSWKSRATKRKSTRKAEQKQSAPNPSPSSNPRILSSNEGDPGKAEDNDINRLERMPVSTEPSLAAHAHSSAFPLHYCASIPSQAQGYVFLARGPVDQFLHTQSYGAEWSSFEPFSSAPTTPLEFTRSLRTILSAARTDPFNSLPMELDPDGQRLFDFYVNDMPACSYGTHFRSTKAHNWYTAVFVPEAMKGAVAFQNAILVHAANTWAWVRNETETPDTLLHRDRAVSMLREHMCNNPRDNSDVAIISCLSAAALEDFDPRPGHKEISWIHMRAAREMIRSRGGPAAFVNTRLGMLINWQDYILSGYETHGPSFFFEPISPPSANTTLSQPVENLHSMPSPPCSTASVLSDIGACPEPASTVTPTHMTSPIDEIRLQCEIFLDFLRRCEQLALYQKYNPESCYLTRYSAVQETSLLYQILAAPPGARFTASGDRKQMVTRLAALMMLNAALWDYRYTPLHAATFLKTLEQAIVNSEVSMSGSVEAILQILLECKDGYVDHWSNSVDGSVGSILAENRPDFSQYSPTATAPSARPWFTGRMLKVAKRLSANSWHRVNDFLFSCLTLQVPETNVYLWEADLRREILDAPLTSYVMPSLMT